MDSLGNNPIRKTFNNANGGGFGKVIQLRDKNFLSGGKTMVDYNLGLSKALLVKFDVTGGVIWSKEFNETAFINGIGLLHELPDDNLIISAYTDSDNNTKKTQFIKLDKNGNIIFKKYIGNVELLSGTNNRIEACTSINPTADKGFILASWFPYKQAPHPYSIIKLDSTGCDTTKQWCQSVALSVNNFKEIIGYDFEVFPNPAKEMVKFNVGGNAIKNYLLVINDITGRKIEVLELNSDSETCLNTSNYQSGIYFTNLFCEGKLLDVKRLIITR
ncbi:MAG: T9SS type A sorting domain-containing protein [Bacteroidetes bacterium]|nr:T9SS type A sorting domain-containing protein [Bacteroidota bacterium]